VLLLLWARNIREGVVMSNQITWENPKMMFGKMCFGITINGQTFWAQDKKSLENTIKQLEKEQ
jgi:hypothetical protein